MSRQGHLMIDLRGVATQSQLKCRGSATKVRLEIIGCITAFQFRHAYRTFLRDLH